MDPEGFALLERWLDERRRRGLGRTNAVFCTLEGRPVQPSYVRQLLPRLARKAGIEKRVHPHGLRHTCAAELAVEGVPVPLIQQQLGHDSLHTTTVYLRHIARPRRAGRDHAPAHLGGAMRYGPVGDDLPRPDLALGSNGPESGGPIRSPVSDRSSALLFW